MNTTKILRSAQNDKRREPRVTGLHPRVMMDGQQTIMKLCGCCNEQMPHKIGARVCILCSMDERDESLPAGQDGG